MTSAIQLVNCFLFGFIIPLAVRAQITDDFGTQILLADLSTVINVCHLNDLLFNLLGSTVIFGSIAIKQRGMKSCRAFNSGLEIIFLEVPYPSLISCWVGSWSNMCEVSSDLSGCWCSIFHLSNISLN